MLQKSEKTATETEVGGGGVRERDDESSHDSKQNRVICRDQTPEIETITITMTFSCPNWPVPLWLVGCAVDLRNKGGGEKKKSLSNPNEKVIFGKWSSKYCILYILSTMMRESALINISTRLRYTDYTQQLFQQVFLVYLKVHKPVQTTADE